MEAFEDRNRLTKSCL